ncbi:MAG: hypothetical protein H7Y11_13840 [Armatimonadetes bacterium]|nr:hypothetical protein [Anaerolineae bacterium]
MLQRLNAQLPDWARPGHPAVRHVLGAPSAANRRLLILQFVAGIVLMTVSTVGVLVMQAQVQAEPEIRPLSATVISALYVPALVGQLLLSVLVVIYSSNHINTERRSRTWDTLRVTSGGVGITLRARWGAAIFYRLSGFVIVLLLVRVLLIALLVYDVSAFGGDYLPLAAGGGVEPALPIPASLLLVSLYMAASLILPLTGLGLEAAIGLLLSTFLRNRIFLLLAQVVYGVARVALSFGLIYLLDRNTNILTMPSTIAAWLTMVAHGAFADWGLRTLNLDYASELWAMVQYGIFVGAGLLVLAFAQAVLADGLVWWAVRRAETRE